MPRPYVPSASPIRKFRCVDQLSALPIALFPFLAAPASPPDGASAEPRTYFSQCHSVRVCNGSYWISSIGVSQQRPCAVPPSVNVSQQSPCTLLTTG